MVSLQILSKVIASGDLKIIQDNLLTKDYFLEYEDEFTFIMEHYDKYGNVPDKVTFLSKFPDTELIDVVTESDKYLVETIREEYLYYKSVPVLQKAANLLKTDANAAAEYMVQSLAQLQPEYSLGGVDIISQSKLRYENFVERRDNKDKWTFTTGFEELDDIIHGIERQEELVVVFARINQGKSFIAEKICVHIWELGFNVGYISPEMSALKVGYRFDTLYKGFSNKALLRADNKIEEQEYKDYLQKLATNQSKFIVATPLDFNRQITVSKLREWVKRYKLDILAIDGITYMKDERAQRGDNKTIALTNISEDLMSLSIELQIPILVVCQANRGGIMDDDQNDTPGLENIKDSDGLAANATKVLSLKHTKEGVLRIGVKKHRDGEVDGQLSYQWQPDTGTFTFIPSYKDAEPTEMTDKKVRRMRKQMKDKEDVF